MAIKHEPRHDKFLDRFWKVFLIGPEWLNTPDIYLYSNYRSSSFALFCWIYGLLIRKFTVPGFLIGFATIIVCGYSLMIPETPVRYLAFALISTFIIDFFIGWIFRSRVKITRQTPERVRAGSELKVMYEIENRRGYPAWDIKLDPFKMKNGLNWIEHAESAVLPGLGKQHLIGSLQAERRGKYTFYSPIAESTFPLGFFKWSTRIRKASSNLLIHPNYFPLNSITLPEGKKYQREGSSRVSKVGESMDFFGCRDFRPGDDPRHIHWPSSARLGELIIREYQEEYLSRVALVIDTYVPSLKSFRVGITPKNYNAELEAALSLTAALVDFLTRDEYVVDIFAAGGEVFHFQAGRSLACLESILDILACIEPNHGVSVDALVAPVLNEIQSIGNCMVIMPCWDAQRQKFIMTLRECGIAVKLMIIDEGKKRNSKTSVPFPPDALILNAEDVLSGKVRSL
jgi:uncharacterized protein (DUF58 family)